MQIHERRVRDHDALPTFLSLILISTTPTLTPRFVSVLRMTKVSRSNTAEPTPQKHGLKIATSLVSFYVSYFFLLMTSLQKAEQKNRSWLAFCFFTRLLPFKQEAVTEDDQGLLKVVSGWSKGTLRGWIRVRTRASVEIRSRFCVFSKPNTASKADQDLSDILFHLRLVITTRRLRFW